jgi:cell division septum initiation protein DivIVA
MGQKVKDLEKELALVIQKNQFAKEEITSLQKQLVERSQSHDTILKAIESKSTEYASAKDLAEEKIRLLE